MTENSSNIYEGDKFDHLQGKKEPDLILAKQFRVNFSVTLALKKQPGTLFRKAGSKLTLAFLSEK